MEIVFFLSQIVCLPQMQKKSSLKICLLKKRYRKQSVVRNKRQLECVSALNDFTCGFCSARQSIEHHTPIWMFRNTDFFRWTVTLVLRRNHLVWTDAIPRKVLCLQTADSIHNSSYTICVDTKTYNFIPFQKCFFK